MRYLVFFTITWAFVVAYDVEVGQEQDISVGDPEHLDDLQFGPNTQRGNSCTINQAGGDMYIYNYGNYGEPTSCKDLRMCGPRSGAYQLNLPGYGEASVYCHMQDLGNCGGGEWTLVMKTDGIKGTFHYDSHLWTDKNPYNILGGKTGLDFQETKLPTYWTTPFTKICLGMKYGQDRFILVHKAADSLYSLIADGQYRATSVGRLTWKSLIGSQASLQRNCNKEGFNLILTDNQSIRARIGIYGNEQDDCLSPDSRIGFGTGGPPDDSNTCGNVADWLYNPDNGEQNINAMGYIFVQ